jgi:hypothetical protein
LEVERSLLLRMIARDSEPTVDLGQARTEAAAHATWARSASA